MSESELPVWVQFISALGPTAVAASVAYVAWRQWETARAKLRFDLFDRRFKVYASIRRLTATAILHGNISSNAFKQFSEATIGAEFLFDGELRKFLSDLHEMAWRAMMARQSLEKSPNHPLLDQLLSEEEEVVKFLKEQDNRTELMFRHALDISKT